MWYAAHVIVYFEYKEFHPEDDITVWENIYLVEASNDKIAYDKAERIAKENLVGDDGHLTLDDREVKMRFGGVRKVVLCENEEDQPEDGTEVSYNKYAVQDLVELSRLCNGEEVNLILVNPYLNDPDGD